MFMEGTGTAKSCLYVSPVIVEMQNRHTLVKKPDSIQLILSIPNLRSMTNEGNGNG